MKGPLKAQWPSLLNVWTQFGFECSAVSASRQIYGEGSSLLVIWTLVGGGGSSTEQMLASAVMSIFSPCWTRWSASPITVSFQVIVCETTSLGPAVLLEDELSVAHTWSGGCQAGTLNH